MVKILDECKKDLSTATGCDDFRAWNYQLMVNAKKRSSGFSRKPLSISKVLDTINTVLAKQIILKFKSN